MNSSPFTNLHNKYIPLEPVVEILTKLNQVIDAEQAYIMEEIWEKLIEKKADTNFQQKESKSEQKLIVDQDLFQKIFYPGFFKKSVKEPIKEFLSNCIFGSEQTEWYRYQFLGALARTVDENHFNLDKSLLR